MRNSVKRVGLKKGVVHGTIVDWYPLDGTEEPLRRSLGGTFGCTRVEDMERTEGRVFQQNI